MIYTPACVLNMELKMGFILVMLISKGQALSCYANKEKSSQTDCLEEDRCGTETIVKYYVDTTGTEQRRDCMPVASCGLWSWSNGSTSVTVNTTCCKGDLCNNGTFPVQAPLGEPNGIYCHTCVAKGCTSQMECRGDQTRCLTLGVQKGCASVRACNALKISHGLENVSCCNSTNLCNGVNDIAQNLLPLILMPFGLFSYLF